MEELGRAAGVGAVRLDRALAELAQRGHRLEYSPTMGVCLRRPASLDAYLIERDLGTRRIGRHVICFPVLDSTNDTAGDSASQPNSDGLVVLAEAQRKGRGRHGRHWFSPPTANVLMSVLLKDPQQSLPQEAVTVSAGLAVAEGIEEAYSLACTLKWPNDVLIDGRKVAGVLVELHAGCNQCDLVVGIGVNVNASPASADVTVPATCLAEHLPGRLERIDLVRAILRRLDDWMVRLEESPSDAIQTLRQRWSHRCAMLNGRYTIASRGRRFTGRVVDIDPLEGLTLVTDTGSRIHLPAEASSVV